MADIQLTCGKCSHVMTVSEFVDESALTCPECGEALIRPIVDSSTKQKRQVGVSTKSFETQNTGEPNEDGSRASDLWPGGKHAPRAPKRAKVRHHLYGWVLFGVLGSIMAYLRFGGILPEVYLEMIKLYAVWIGIALHLLTILKAFEDSVFQGILCLLIPFYTLYYILCVTDAVYFRATVCGLLAGVGMDAGMVMQDEFFTVCEFIRAWMAKGG